MEQFLEFIGSHWILSSAFLGLWVLFFLNDSIRSGATISVHQVAPLVNHQGGIIVDLRDSAEFRGGHIVDALNIPFAKLKESVAELNKYKDKPIILVDKMGQHSGTAGKQLKAEGFENVKRLTGGIATWTGDNLPLVK